MAITLLTLWLQPKELTASRYTHPNTTSVVLGTFFILPRRCVQ